MKPPQLLTTLEGSQDHCAQGWGSLSVPDPTECQPDRAGDAARVRQRACSLGKRRLGDGRLTSRRTARVFSNGGGRHCRAISRL